MCVTGGCYKVSKDLEVFNFIVALVAALVADVGVGLGSWRFIHVASIWQDGWVACGTMLSHTG